MLLNARKRLLPLSDPFQVFMYLHESTKFSDLCPSIMLPNPKISAPLLPTSIYSLNREKNNDYTSTKTLYCPAILYIIYYTHANELSKGSKICYDPASELSYEKQNLPTLSSQIHLGIQLPLSCFPPLVLNIFAPKQICQAILPNYH